MAAEEITAPAGADEELQLLRGVLGEAMAARFPADWEPGAPGDIDADAWAEATELGWDQVALPEDQGGFGSGIVALMTLAEMAGRHRLPLPLVETALARGILAAAGIEQPEPGAVLTVAPLLLDSSLALTSAPSGLFLNGTARRLPWARAASHAVVGGSEGVVLADLRSDGIRVVPSESLAREPRDDVRFDGAQVVAHAADPALAEDLAARAGLVRCAQIHGALVAALALTREHTASRRQFGRTLDSFQMVGAHLAQMAAHLALVEASLRDATAAHGGPAGPTARTALKVIAAEAAGAAARSAHQCHGAIGVTAEYRLGHYTTRLWSWREEFGDEFEARAALGREALRAAGPGLWALSEPRLEAA
ncbi:MAG: acyl-CoA dehydrogenase family protein [Actinobacteria bacterium]|nr:acyl-CoA dehydrogenase family protein [Actinomycetota bacterium]